MAKCPKCDSVVQNVKAEPILCEFATDKPHQQGFSYLCPNCNSILGLYINPPSLQDQALANE